MRWISRLLVILIVCLVAVALPAAPAQAASPYISLSPPSGVPGDEVTVQGHNFTANTGVDVYYYLDTINSTDRKRIEVETDDDGYFIVIFEVPESYKGVHEVRAYIDTTLQTTGNFTVKPGLTISPTEGPVGKNATVQGHGFAKNETGIKLIYYLDGNYTTIAQNISADGDGWWLRRGGRTPTRMASERWGRRWTRPVSGWRISGRSGAQSLSRRRRTPDMSFGPLAEPDSTCTADPYYHRPTSTWSVGSPPHERHLLVVTHPS